MKLERLIAAAVIAVGVYGAKNWTQGALGAGGADAAATASRADLEVNLSLGFKTKGGWIEEGEDRKVFLRGTVRNMGDATVRRVVVEASIQDRGSLGGPDRYEIDLGTLEPGERGEYEELVAYLLPYSTDARGNELFGFNYELEVVEVE